MNVPQASRLRTVLDALTLGASHWAGRPGSSSYTTQATRGAFLLGLDRDLAGLTSGDAVRVLAGLRGGGLSPKSVGSYYGALLRCLKLAGGVNVTGWPKAPGAPRRTRDELAQGDIDRLRAWFMLKGWPETADLVVMLKGTGLRVQVEGLTQEALYWSPPEGGNAWGVLRVTGKGGHERVIPVVDPEAVELLGHAQRLEAMRDVPYRTHLGRWKKGTAELGIKSRLATPHAVRHGYASETLRRSGGNLAMVQELLGHADPATTARYLHSDLSEKVKALTQAL